MRKTLVVLVILISVSAVLAQPQTPPAPAPLTWLRYFNVDPAHANDFMDVFNRIDVPMLDGMVANHQIVAWGLTVPLTNTGADWTHMVYITMANWAQADAVMSAMSAAARTAQPADNAMMMTAVRGTRDVVLRHISQNTMPFAPGYAPHYIRVAYYTVKPGRANDAINAFNKFTAPLYANLVQHGALGPWGLSQQEIVTDPSFTHVTWYFFDSLARLDETRNAFNNMPPDQRGTLMATINDASDTTKYRSEVLRIVRMSALPAPPAR